MTTRKDKQAATEERRRNLKLEMMDVIQASFKENTEKGGTTKDCLYRAFLDLDEWVNQRIKASPQEKAFIIGAVVELRDTMQHVFATAAEERKKGEAHGKG